MDWKYENLPAPLKLLYSVLQKVWLVWVICVFTMTGLVALCFYVFIFNFFSEKRATLYTFYVTKGWGKALLLFSLVRVKTSGYRLDPKKNYVMISNHVSASDIPVCMASASTPFAFLAKIEVDKIPIVGYLARNMHVYVERKTTEGRKASIKRMEDYVLSGKSIHIYVEGTRNKSDDPLGSFYDGAFKLAIKTQTPLAIATICGSNRVMTPKDPLKISPAYVQCIWEAPVETKGMTMDDLEYLKQLAREKMIANLRAVQASEITH
ncbi:MAG: 1-acyl-sn-glycerol-3-phosphate acyltransferase [Aureispira sp.]|nr:1-acyl-sn-glycerol-3-phosphate acyltransferase [Aureispira sp.]